MQNVFFYTVRILFCVTRSSNDIHVQYNPCNIHVYTMSSGKSAFLRVVISKSIVFLHHI